MRRAVTVLFVTVTLALAGCAEESRRAGDQSVVNPEAGADRGAAKEVAVADSSTVDADGPAVKVDSSGGADGPKPTYDCNNPDPAWLLCDDFEGMSAGIDAWFIASGWTEGLGKDDPGRMTSSTDAHNGKHSVHFPAAASAGYRGADLIWRACAGTNKPGCVPLKGYSTLYLRAFVKLASDHMKVHHFLNLGGGPLDDYWAPYGNAGCRPNGKRAMGTTVDFKSGSHETFFYTYFPTMKCTSDSSCAQICIDCAKKDMPCTNGPECCWGNHFAPTPAVALPLGTWFCFEMMMKHNDIGKKNGEMAYWIDGKLAHKVTAMEWRLDSNLQLNKARLQHYLTTSDADGHSNKVWFDDVVVSTQPVGCQ